MTGLGQNRDVLIMIGESLNVDICRFNVTNDNVKPVNVYTNSNVKPVKLWIQMVCATLIKICKKFCYFTSLLEIYQKFRNHTCIFCIYMYVCMIPDNLNQNDLFQMISLIIIMVCCVVCRKSFLVSVSE